MSEYSKPDAELPAKASEGSRIDRMRKLAKAKRRQIETDNERTRSERNAKRWKTERDPAAYERQKEKQRQAYAAAIAANEGRVVRAYSTVPGRTKAERAENRKLRDAERKAKVRLSADQDKKDREADRKWVARQRKKGRSQKQIDTGLAELQAKRLFDRKYDPGKYEDNPNYGAF